MRSLNCGVWVAAERLGSLAAGTNLKSTSHNSLLYLNPEIIDELKNFVYVPDSAEALTRL